MSWYLDTWEDRFEERHFVEVTRIRYIRDEDGSVYSDMVKDGPVHSDAILVKVAPNFENRIFLNRVDLIDKTHCLTPEQQRMWDRLVKLLGGEKSLIGDDPDWYMRVRWHSCDRQNVDNYFVLPPKGSQPDAA